MKLFPYTLVRVSGGPFARLQELQLQQSSQLAEVVYKQKAKIDLLKNRLSETLYSIVGDQTDSERRVALINLRRDIFNEREVLTEQVTALADSLPADVMAEIMDYIALKEEIDRLYEQGESVYCRELAAAKSRLDALAQAENLQKGLILSSQSLLKYGIPNYLGKTPDELGKQEKKTELSLIKYLSRIYAKTSPFSVFTNLALGKWVEVSADNAPSPFLSLNGQTETAVISHIRLNNGLYKYLLDLLRKYPAVYRRLPLRPNPTLTQEADCYLFLTNSNNVESFQRMPLDPVLALFQELSSAERGGVIYSEIVQTIIDNEYIDAPAETIEAYMDQLIAYGFLEFNVGVSGIDPDWDLKLRARLSALCGDIRLVDELLSVLTQLREMAGQYERTDVAGRQQFLERAFERFKAICMTLHEAAGLPEEERLSPEEYRRRRKQLQEEKPTNDEEAEREASKTDPKEKSFTHLSSTIFQFRPEQMFYEDTALAGELHLNREGVAEIASTLNNLLQELGAFEGQWDEQEKMRLHFERTYEPNESVNLLTFYEDYYREYKAPEQERERQLHRASPAGKAESDEEATSDEEAVSDEETAEKFIQPSVDAKKAQNQSWLHHYAGLLKEQGVVGAEQIDLSLSQVIETNEAQGSRCQLPSRNAYGAFLQFFELPDETGNGRLMAVINGSFPGYGKMTSRFLHLFPETLTQTTRCWNESLSREDLFIESTDASYFNANLHPALMPFEVWIPGGHNSLPAERQIAVTELQVALNKEEKRLCLLRQPFQKRAYMFDLGFQGRRGRSQLFGLLDQFTLAEYVSPWPLVSAVNQLIRGGRNEAEEGLPQIQVSPRIVYEDRLVLRRKTWLAPKALLPLRQPEESDWRYFARVNAWRLSLELPDEVFVYLFDRQQTESLSPEAWKRVGRDDYKPQYISFHNPFLMTVFEKLLVKAPSDLKIVEMLPNSRQLLAIGDGARQEAANKFVTEFVVQWYKGASL